MRFQLDPLAPNGLSVAPEPPKIIQQSGGHGWLQTAPAASGGSGAVDSVNGQTGAVVLTAEDVLPDETGNSGKFLTTDGTSSSWGSPSGSGDMLASTYDPNNVDADAFNQDNMVDGTTNKNYTATEKTKLAGIASGAEVNVQSDWNAVSGDAEILNKPTIPTNNNQLTNGAGYLTAETDPVYAASEAANITATDITNLGNLSGTNTGDQDLSGYIPYTGATADVDLGNFNLTIGTILTGNGQLVLVVPDKSDGSDQQAITLRGGATTGTGKGSDIVLQPGPGDDPTHSGKVSFSDGYTGNYLNFDTSLLTVDRNITFPDADATLATTDDLTDLVTGPSSATDNTVPRYDSTTGKLIQDSSVVIDDSGNIFTGFLELNASGAITGADLTDASNTFPTFNQNTTGSAAKLTTARNIGGVAFDGSAAINLTSGSSLLKGNGSGGFSNATAGTDYLAFSGTTKISVGTSTPSSPSSGDIWIDTN